MKPLRTLAWAAIGFLLNLQVVPAITIVPTQPGAVVPGEYDPEDQYEIFEPSRVNKWDLTLSPASVTLLPRGGTNGFKKLLAPFEKPLVAFGGNWKFVPASGDLSGAFVIHQYATILTVGPGPSPVTEAIGALITESFAPGPTDPTPLLVNYHWIQRLTAFDSGEGPPFDAPIYEGDFIDVPIPKLKLSLADPNRLFYPNVTGDPLVFVDMP